MNNGPPSYILRLSGSSSEKWRFWLEVSAIITCFFQSQAAVSLFWLLHNTSLFQANGSEPLKVDVAVLDQHLVAGAKKLKSLFPGWVDVTGYSSFLSSYTF